MAFHKFTINFQKLHHVQNVFKRSVLFEREGIDDVTGEHLIARKDVSAEALVKRLEKFQSESLPVLDHYRVNCRYIFHPSPYSIFILDDEHCLCELIIFFLRFDILVWRIFVLNSLLRLIVLGSYKHITSNRGSKGEKV